VTPGEKVQGTIDANLVEFEKHKETLLGILRGVYLHSPAAKPFDEGKAWSHLTNTAASFLFEEQVKTMSLPVAERVTRLRSLNKALRHARSLADRAMQDEVGDDLYSAWCEDIDQPQASVIRNDDNSLALVRPAREMFTKVVAGLSELEAAAARAADEVHKERAGGGRPKGTAVLPPGFIIALASVYRKITDAKPDTGNGPFVRLVRGFLDATGHEGRPSERHLLEMIEVEHANVRANPSGWAPSPFDE